MLIIAKALRTSALKPTATGKQANGNKESEQVKELSEKMHVQCNTILGQKVYEKNYGT